MPKHIFINLKSLKQAIHLKECKKLRLHMSYLGNLMLPQLSLGLEKAHILDFITKVEENYSSHIILNSFIC